MRKVPRVAVQHRTKASFFGHDGSISMTFINEGLTPGRTAFLIRRPDLNSQITRPEFQNPPRCKVIKESCFGSVKITEMLKC